MMITGKHKKINIDAVTELLYLSAVAMYILKTFFDTTLFSLPWPGNYENVLRILVCIVCALKLLCTESYVNKEWLVCILTCLMFKLSWISTGYGFLLDIALLAIGAVGVPYKKVLKVGFLIGLLVMALAMLGSFTGCIPDLIYSNGRLRHSFGIVYPTDFAAHITFLALIGWTIFGGTLFSLPIICVLGLAAFVYYYCNALCSTLVLCLFAMAMLYFTCTEKYKRTHAKIPKIITSGEKALPWLMPLGALLTISLTFFYDAETPIMLTLDKLLHNRLHLGKAALDTYGLKLFGTAFDLIGAGGSTYVKWWNYNFVDISYVLIFVRYGVMVVLAILVQHIWMGKKALKNGQRRLALSVALVAIHSMIEHHLPEPSYNTFMLIPFSNLICDGRKSAESTGNLKKNYVLPACALVAGIALFAIFPRFIGYMKTLVDILHLGEQGNNIWFVVIVTGILLAVGMLVQTVYKIITMLAAKTSLTKAIYARLGVLLIVFITAILKSEQLIKQNWTEYQDVIEVDRTVIDALLASEEPIGKIYIDYIPEIYIREFGSISNRILPVEGAVAEKNITLFVKDDAELNVLISAGYEYGEITQGHIVYTNSESAKKILENLGIICGNDE